MFSHMPPLGSLWAADGTLHRPSFSSHLLCNLQSNTKVFTVRENAGAQGRQWLLSEHGSHSLRFASAETMNSARPSAGRYPEGGGSLLTDSRRRDMGDCFGINPKCHILPLVLSFRRAQLTPVI